ncbi:MAG: GatB/YqeY domain-containing protein [Nitrospiria bacterium]
MLLREKLNQDLKDSMRSREADRLSVIRLLFSAIKNKEIEKGKNVQLTDEEILKVVSAAAKQRKESIAQFSKSDRVDLIEKEKKELAILQNYLPEPLSKEALKEKVEEAISEIGATEMRQMGAVMKILVPRLSGRADGNVIREMVQASLQKKM